MAMRRILLSLLIAFFAATISYAQHPLGEAIKGSMSLIEQKRPKDAFDFWMDKSNPYKTDSLFVWSSSVVAQSFMTSGYMAEAETLLKNAENTLNLLESDSHWWFEHLGYFQTRKACLYVLMHNTVLARICASNAKVAYEHIGERGFDYAYTLSVLAEVSMAEGRLVIANTFAGQALWTALQALKANCFREDDYPDFSQVLMANGNIELGLGHYEQAAQLFETLKGLNAQFNCVDPDVDLFLGIAYIYNGKYEKAETILSSYYEQCNNVQKKIKCGINLLYAQYKLGRNSISALAYDIAKFQEGMTSRLFSFMSEKEKEKWWMTNENTIISIADAILLQSGLKDVNGIIANNEIFSKGLLLRSSNMIKNAALNSCDKSIVDAYYALEGLKRKQSETLDKSEQSWLEQEVAVKEKELQRKLNVTINDVASWRDVSSSLNNEEVALEFVRFDDFENDDAANYYAIIVKKGDKEPKIIHLFNESSLKQIIENRGNKKIMQYVTELYSTGEPQYKGKELYDLIWSAIEKEIKGFSKVYYSPVGMLNSISLQAISNGKQCLGQKYVMHLVSSIGEIPHIKKNFSTHGNNAVVYGGIQYDAEESELVQSSRAYSRGNSEIWEPGTLGIRSRKPESLPFMKIEAEVIGSILANNGYTVETLSGISANEESFKALSGKDINTIHIATHGFFLSEQKDIKRDEFLNSLMLDNIGRVDPMLRSGLLFAGSRRVYDGKRRIEGIEDGVLTAKEIASLDFSNVKLIVMSACQTGLGEVKANEGVYGLQRAFKLAGAETLIMSLWEVNDKATSLLMKTFYEEYLSGKSKDIAFRNAVNKVRSYRDADDCFSSPYYWAAFIMMD